MRPARGDGCLRSASISLMSVGAWAMALSLNNARLTDQEMPQAPLDSPMNCSKICFSGTKCCGINMSQMNSSF